MRKWGNKKISFYKLLGCGKNGTLIKYQISGSGESYPLAFIVVPSIKQNGRIVPVTGTNVGSYATGNQIKALPVYGDWNVSLKYNGSGSTLNVNITNVIYESYMGRRAKKTGRYY